MAEVTDTAAAIARVRAEESERPPVERLFEDPLARLFTGGASGAEATELMLCVPFFREYVRARTRFIDDAVRAALAGGLRQLVLLGAGFDTRALRMPEIEAAAAAVFEVDLAEQLERKRAILAAAGVALPVWDNYASCDFSIPGWERDLGTSLAQRGFQRGAGTLFVWEGVIGYLDDAAVERSLRFMASAAGRPTRLALNYPAGRFPGVELALRLACTGFAVVEDENAGELFRRYVPGERRPGDNLFRLAVAELR